MLCALILSGLIVAFSKVVAWFDKLLRGER